LEVPENAAYATPYKVGKVTADDHEGYGLIYYVVNSNGFIDDRFVTIRDSNNVAYLWARGPFNHEDQAQQSIDIKIVARSARFPNDPARVVERPLTFKVTDVAEAPKNGWLVQNTELTENVKGAFVGHLYGFDEDAIGSDQLKFVLHDSMTSKYYIKNNNELWLQPGVQFEAEDPNGQINHRVLFYVQDFNGGQYSQTSQLFTQNFTVKDVNDAPHDISLSPQSVKENSAAGTLVGMLHAADQDASQTQSGFIYKLVDAAGNEYDSLGNFKIVGNRLVVSDTANLNYEQAQSHNVKIRVYDQGRLLRDETYTISVQDVVEESLRDPENLRLENALELTVDEGTNFSGTLSATDPDGTTVSFRFFNDNVTFTQNHMFRIEGNQLQLRPEFALNWEALDADKRVKVMVEAFDQNGGSTYQTFVINVRNVLNETNQAPVISNLPDPYRSFFDTHLVQLFEKTTFTDLNGNNLTVTIRMDRPDLGVVTGFSRGTYSVNGNVGTYVVTGTAAEVRDAVQSLRFDPNDQPSAGAFSGLGMVQFRMSVYDGTTTVHAPDPIVIDLFAKNRAPSRVMAVGNGDQGRPEVVEETSNVFVATLQGFDSNAGDSQALDFTLAGDAISQKFQISNNILSLKPDAALDWETANVEPDTGLHYYDIYVIATDRHGGDSLSSTPQKVRIYVTDNTVSDNEAPTLEFNGQTSFKVAAFGGAVYAFKNINIVDTDKVTLTIKFAAAEGELYFGNHTGVTVTGWKDGTDRVFSLEGMPADLMATLQNFWFVPAYRADGADVVTEFSFGVKDKYHGDEWYIDPIQVTSTVNDWPSLTVVEGQTSFPTNAVNGVAHPFAGIRLQDAEGDAVTLTIKHDFSLGKFNELLSGNGVQVKIEKVGTTETVTLTGNAAAIQTFLAGVTYNPEDRLHGPNLSSHFSMLVSDEYHVPRYYHDLIEVISVTADNAAPTLAIPNPTTDATDNGAPVFLFRGVDITDVDNDILTMKISFRKTDGNLLHTGNATYTDVGETRTYTFKGKADALDAILSQLSFDPNEGFAGPTGFTIEVSDLNHTATG
jgi:hypothetical protein